ncbi:MAG: hypothetical protein O2780_20295 [Proteobacteria bacterium]|nr:hypothetical protein [Pseudomonadota bacterium]
MFPTVIAFGTATTGYVRPAIADVSVAAGKAAKHSAPTNNTDIITT